MDHNTSIIGGMDIQEIELQGFSRSFAELEWLLLILVLLYYVSPGAYIGNSWYIICAMVAYSLFVLAFRYSNFFTNETTWKLAIETWAMIIFISWVIFYTGGVDSPLINLYLLVIVASALTLGKLVTLLEFALITSMYFYLGYPKFAAESFSIVNFSQLMILFSPFLLVGYLTTMLSADVRHGRQILELISETDELTGLQNRRAFNNSITQEIRKAIRYERPLSVMLIDADNLKKVNDNYGHDAGDRLIRNLCATIKEALRESDLLARLGGDEFVAILPETDSNHALEAGERIRIAVENTSFNIEGNKISSTVSIGIASYPEDSNEPEDLLDKADKAMYQCKDAGRNNVARYSESVMA